MGNRLYVWWQVFLLPVRDLFLILFVLFFCIANQENPELIWNTEAREKICTVVQQLKDR